MLTLYLENQACIQDRLVFKTGLYSRQALIQDTTVIAVHGEHNGVAVTSQQHQCKQSLHIPGSLVNRRFKPDRLLADPAGARRDLDTLLGGSLQDKHNIRANLSVHIRSVLY